jgi:hypothetical protein
MHRASELLYRSRRRSCCDAAQVPDCCSQAKEQPGLWMLIKAHFVTVVLSARVKHLLA